MEKKAKQKECYPTQVPEAKSVKYLYHFEDLREMKKQELHDRFAVLGNEGWKLAQVADISMAIFIKEM